MEPSQDSLEQRKRLFSELIRTEITYVAELAYAVRVYREGFLQHRLLTQEECDIVFRNYTEILAFHKSLFFAASPPALALIGHFFSTHLHQVALYTQYIESFEKATRVFRVWVEQRKPLRKFLEACKKDPDHLQLDFESFLFLPIQRVLRYTLFLEGFLHHTERSHEDAACLVVCVQTLRQWARWMNASQRAQRDRENVLEAYASMEGPLPSMHAGRRFLRRGHVHLAAVLRMSPPHQTLVQVSVHADRHMVLFNDLLVVCSGRTPPHKLQAILHTPHASIEQGYLRIQDNTTLFYFSGPPRSLATWLDAIQTRGEVCVS